MEILNRLVIFLCIILGSGISIFILGMLLRFFGQMGDSKGEECDFIKGGSFHVIDKECISRQNKF